MTVYNIVVQYSTQEKVFIEADNEDEMYELLSNMFCYTHDMEVLSMEEEKSD